MLNNPTNATGQVNVEELRNAAQETLIHIELTKTYFSISSPELVILEEGATSIWKDISLSGYGIGVPCAINAVIEYQKQNIFNSEIFWNSLIGGVALIIAAVFSIVWYKSINKCSILIKDIKSRPKYKMP